MFADAPIDTLPLINIMNAYVDDCEKEGFSFDQSTALVVQQSLTALVASLIDLVLEQNNPYEIRISPNFCYGLMATVEWINDRLEVSRLASSEQ